MDATREYRARRLMFGDDAELYDRARPSYPAELIDELVAWVGQPARVVDVGCGTGKAALLLAARGLTGVGVEPHRAMAEIARRRLGLYAGWRVDAADFEAWPPLDRDVPADLVTCAQAWHWIDPDVGLCRAYRLLRPGGWLALWWNWAESDPSPLREALDAVYAAHGPEHDFRTFRPPTTVPEPMPPAVPFGRPVERRYPWTATYTGDGLLELLATFPNHRLLPEPHRTRLLDDIHSAVDAHGGCYVQHYVTHLWAVQRP